MPVIPTIKQVLTPLFEVPLGPDKVFVLVEDRICTVHANKLNVVDKDYYYVGYDDDRQLNIIAKRVV